jgi:hypothetical protein
MTPKFKIVPLADISPLMTYNEEKAEFLKNEIARTGAIPNPLSLAPAGNHKYILIEDSAILEAAHRLELANMPSQISGNLECIKIEADFYVSGLERPLVDDFLARFPRSFNFANNGNRDKAPANSTRLHLTFADRSTAVIDFYKTSGAALSPFLFIFLEFIRRQREVAERIFPTDIKSANLKKRDGKAVLRFVNLSMNDLIFTARLGRLFPAGLLKFENGVRLMGINYPLSVLNESVSIREKEKFLLDLINYRLSNDHPEFIRNGIFFAKR